MNKRLTALLILAALLLAAVLLPENGQPQPHNVVHQHEVWPQESEDATGFDVFGNLTTHLPLLIIQTSGQEVPGITRETEEKLICDYAIIDNPDGVNHSGDVPTQTGTMAISIRGNSSRAFPKKQYAVRLVDQEGMPEKQSLLGMPAESTWVLNGSYIDHSQIRNYMLYNISGEIMDYAPRCRLCEVMLTNESDHVMYQGIYTLIEKPKVSENRLNLTPYDPKYTETSFILQMNAYIDGMDIPHLKADDVEVMYRSELVYPDTFAITETSANFVKNEMLSFEKALYNADHTGNWGNIDAYIDMSSFVDYYIINEFFQNYDAGRRSTYLFKDLGGKVCIGPVWDFDSAFNNFEHAQMEIDWLDVKTTFYYYYLSQCPTFIDQVNERYTQLRKSVLSDEYLIAYIDSCDAYLGNATRRNCDKWYSSDYALYYDDIDAMKTFVINRGKWMDSHFVEHSKLVN